MKMSKVKIAAFIVAVGAASAREVGVSAPAHALKFDWEWGGEPDCIKKADDAYSWFPESAIKMIFFNCENSHGKFQCSQSQTNANHVATPSGCDESLAMLP
jgi:hypothetical protein